MYYIFHERYNIQQHKMQQEEYLHTKLREIRDQNKIIDALAAKLKDSEILIGNLTVKIYEMDDKIKSQEVMSEVTLNAYEAVRLGLECLVETLAKDYCRDFKHSLARKQSIQSAGLPKPAHILRDALNPTKFVRKPVQDKTSWGEISNEIMLSGELEPLLHEKVIGDGEREGEGASKKVAKPLTMEEQMQYLTMGYVIKDDGKV